MNQGTDFTNPFRFDLFVGGATEGADGAGGKYLEEIFNDVRGHLHPRRLPHDCFDDTDLGFVVEDLFSLPNHIDSTAGGSNDFFGTLNDRLTQCLISGDGLD
jgi:hypothetical protein